MPIFLPIQEILVHFVIFEISNKENGAIKRKWVTKKGKKKNTHLNDHNKFKFLHKIENREAAKIIGLITFI